MKKYILFSFTVLFLSINLNAQKVEKLDKNVPVSIYTFSSLKEDPNNIFALNDRLNLSSYKFVFVNQVDLDTKVASINFKDIGTKPSAFIYDDYNSYQTDNPLKGFTLKNDPTRWNLQCIENRIQPYFLNKK